MTIPSMPDDAPASEVDRGALVVVHGRAVGCKFELRRRQLTVGGAAGDSVRLEGLAPCVLRLDRTPSGWGVTVLADTLDVAVDGVPISRGALGMNGELWVDATILRLVPRSIDAYEDVMFRVSTLDGVTAVPNHRWFHELVARDRVRAERNAVPLSLATFRLVGVTDVWAAHGPVATHRLLRAIAARLRQTLGDRPLGRTCAVEFTALLEGNLDARYPFVDALRRAVADVTVETRTGPACVRAVAAIADVAPAQPIEALEAEIDARLAQADDGLVAI
jgi:GGDEF domain-containing protein